MALEHISGEDDQVQTIVGEGIVVEATDNSGQTSVCDQETAERIEDDYPKSATECISVYQVQMDASKVLHQTLKELRSDKCILAFANIKDVNENLREKVQISEITHEKLKRDFKTRIAEKDLEISSLKHEATITKDQLQTIIEKYQNYKKDLESIHITYERWVESCNNYGKRKSNVKFGAGLRKHDQEQLTNTSIDLEMVIF
ncbi:hypothetical protein Hanom_Chr03g00184771 [Helianthus anomalus]